MKVSTAVLKDKKWLLILFFYLVIFVYLELKTQQLDTQIIYNPSPSMPEGFYNLSYPTTIERGMSVLFPVPEEWYPLFYGRGFLKEKAPLIKYVGAVEGDEVCVVNKSLFINKQNNGLIFDTDSQGLSLPKVLPKGCTMVEPGFFLPIGLANQKSLDGRYIGFIKSDSIIGETKPLWIF